MAYILSVDDYEDDAAITECTENGCEYEIKLKKKGEKSFSLEWKYLGQNYAMKYSITIRSVLIVGEDKKWRAERSQIIIGKTGDLSFEADMM